jgi:hypothetical protein
MSALPEDLLPPFLAVDEEPLTDDEILGFIEAVAVDGEDDPHRPRWSIDSDEEAEWAMRKLAYEERALRTINDQAEDWAGRIQQWRDEATKPHKSTAAFFRGALEDYARRQRDEGRLSVPLPSGKVSTRNVPAAVKVADEATVLAALPDELRSVVVKESVRLRELQSVTRVDADGVILPDGSLLPGAIVEPERVSVTVKPS